MEFSRRTFLRAGLLTATGAAVSCRSIDPSAPEELLLDLPDPPPTRTTTIQPAVANGSVSQSDRLIRILNRGGYGPRPDDLADAIALGFEGYLAQQLDPSKIEDSWIDRYLKNNRLMQEELSVIIEEEPRDLLIALSWETIARKLYSRRQLYEEMVEFWSDHFHIYPRKARPLFALKIIDDQQVIRPNALGRFRDLLTASLYSPAMLVYLDNARNLAASPNENYARELLELHTLGVDAGYTQADVETAARLLSGLTISRRGNQKGAVVFRNREHDNEEKLFMGERFPAGQGEKDIAQLIDLLARHPQTARFISAKLIRRFVSDDPPADLIDSASDVFLESEGDIREVLSHILLSPHFATAPPKLKRPLKYFVSACRALDAEVRLTPQLGDLIATLGQLPFMWPAPNGYPDVAAAWTGTLLARWNFALALAHNDIRGVDFPPISDDFLSQAVNLPYLSSESLRTHLMAYAAENGSRNADLLRGDLLALWLSSADFQWI